MVNKPLDMKYVYKRERCLAVKRSVDESAIEFNESKFMDIESSEFNKNRIEDYLQKECFSYKTAVNLLENLYESSLFTLLESCTSKVENYVIPTVENKDLTDCITAIKESNIGDVNKDRLLEACKLYKSVDRIRSNHHKLTKRFGLNEVTNRYKSDKDICKSICEMVDTYNLDPFIKFNIALEELSYLGFYNGKKIDDAVLVENVTNYFLLRENNTQEDIDNYKRGIRESKVLTEDADENIKFLMSNKKSNGKYWLDRLNEWKIDPDKNINTLVEIATGNYENITALRTILHTIDEFTDINGKEFDLIKVFESAISDELTGDKAHNIINMIHENNISNSDELLSTLRGIWEADINDKMYDFKEPTEPKTFSVDDIDKFTMHNMVADAQEIGEFLDKMEKTSLKDAPVKVEKLSIFPDGYFYEKKFADMEVHKENYIDNTDHLSEHVRSYSYEGNVEDIYPIAETTVKCANNILYNRPSYLYYMLGENRIDFFIGSKFEVYSESDKSGFSDYEKELICNIDHYKSIAEAFEDSPIDAILDKLQDPDYAATVSEDEVALVYEIMSPYIDPENNFMDEFVELCRQEANPRFNKIREACADIVFDEFDPYDDNIARIEFCAYDVMGLEPVEEAIDPVQNIKNATSQLLGKKKENNTQNAAKSTENKPAIKKAATEDADDEDDEDDDEEEIKKPAKVSKPAPEEVAAEAPSEKSKTSLNDIKLAWQGVKSKLNHASAKEKEMSRDLDMTFNHLCKSIESTFSVDHREEIITGEVNRSLSKIIKIAISLAGIGAASTVAGIPFIVAPAIGAIMLFAKSKATSVKEKKMILDEIDIELQVLDREIQRAESSGSTKKYRALLTLQRNLQRKRQEIYYGLARKGKKVPMQPTTGLRGRE